MSLVKFLRRIKDIGLSGPFTRWYDKNTRKNRMDEMRGYVNEVAAHLKDSATVLEVAPGPGYFSIELAKMGNYNVTGMDISADFIKICSVNAQKENVVNTTFVVGNVSAMPFEEKTFDFIFCSAAFKNFKTPVVALKEMHRVLKENGIALIVDLRRDISKQVLEKEVGKMGKSGLERFFIKSQFKNLSKYAYKKDDFLKMITQTSFSNYEIKESGIGFYVYLYK